MNENGAVSAAELSHREAVEAAARAAASSDAPRADELTLSNGVKLKIKPVSGLLVRRAVQMIRKPQVPMWHNPERGRDEPNPADPDYLAALEEYETATQNAALNLLLILGTELISAPPSITPLDDDSWLQDMDICGIPVARDGKGRYRDWLSYIVLAHANDMVAVEAAVTMASGLSEGDIAKAMDSFRRDEMGGADSKPDAENDRDGDRLRALVPVDRAGDGGEGSGDLPQHPVERVARTDV